VDVIEVGRQITKFVRHSLCQNRRPTPASIRRSCVAARLDLQSP
jgi:hypothetical protein